MRFSSGAFGSASARSEKDHPLQSNVIRATVPKTGSETLLVCALVIANMSPMKSWLGSDSESHSIAMAFFSAFRENLRTSMSCGFFNVKRKLVGPMSALPPLLQSQYSRVKLPNIFVFMSTIRVRLLACSSERRKGSLIKSSRPRHFGDQRLQMLSRF
jgi:hypothetical protein